MKCNVYNLGKIAGGNFDELNIAIVNGDKIILSDSDAVHTVNNLSDKILLNKITGHDIVKSDPIDCREVGEWIRTFGSRIENNYKLLLKSIKEIGLNPKDFPRSN